MADVTIRPSKNGPYIVEGNVDLYDTDGNKMTLDKRASRCAAAERRQTNLFATALIARSRPRID